jgi:hypothetical protein
MKPTAISSHSAASCLQRGHASFWRHREIFRNEGGRSAGQASARPSPQHFDEFPVGYSWASCSPAELASASPTASHFAVTGPKPSSARRAQVASSPHRAGRQEKISLSGQGEVFLLDIPSYRTRPLPAYLDEMTWRFNNRKNPFLFRDTVLKLIASGNLESLLSG